MSEKKALIILIFVFLLSILSFPEQNPDQNLIRGLGRPVGINIDNDQLYIIENARIHIYSLRNIKHRISFGKQGQGPGEFHTLPHVPVTLDCSTDELIIGSIRKISYYSKNGVLKREVKGENLAYKLVFLDRKNDQDRFLGWSRATHSRFNYNTIVVFDHELKKVKQIYEAKDPYQGPGKGYEILTRVFDFASQGGKVIIPGRDNRSLDILDQELKLDFSLIPDTRPIKVPEQFKQELLHYLKTSAETKNAYPMIKPVRFPEYFPAVQSFFTDGGKIYIMTWDKTAAGNIFFTYRIDGEFISETALPVRHETATQPYPMAIKNGKLYQIVENTDAEEWELTICNIKK